MKSNRGFSLLETLLYLAIFAIVGGSLFGILTNVVRVSTREISGDEVASQLQFAIGTINRLVRESSNIEMATSTATTTLKLRMLSATQDPTCVLLANGVLKLAQGPDPYQPQNCTATTTDITTDKVVVDSALFRRNEFPGGHDQVMVDMQFSNTAVGANRISRALRSGISRASAATFDSDLLPNQDALYEVGSSIPGGKRWKNAAFSGNLNVSGNVGIGTVNPTQQLEVTKNILLPSAVGATNGNLFFNGNTAAGANGLRIFSVDVSGGGFIDARVSDVSKGLLFRVDTFNGGTERMRITAGGNVGIGLISPGTKLHVSGAPGTAANEYTTMAVSSDTNAAKRLVFSYSDASDAGTIASVHSGVAWKNTLINPVGGNVGIGTATPGQKLSVAGVIESTSGGFKFPDATVQTTKGMSIVASGVCLTFKVNVWSGQSTVTGGASCNPLPHQLVNCPAGTNKIVTIILDNAGVGGEGAICVQ